MIKKGDEIKDASGNVLAIANRDLYQGQIRRPDDLLLADGSKPVVGSEMPIELVEALTKLSMRPL